MPRNVKLQSIVKNSGIKISKTPEFIIIHGGDGTFATAATRTLLPLLFVRDELSVGYLAEISLNELKQSLEKIKNNEFRTEKMMKLESGKLQAFYDIYITHSTGEGSIQYKIKSKSVETTMLGSGVIFSTPQGSTGYTRSADGPVVKKERIVVTHICPYDKIKLDGKIVEAPKKRWYILKPEEEITFELQWPKEASLHADGRFIRKIKRGEKIKIRKAGSYANIIRFSPETSYVDMVDVVVERDSKILLIRRDKEPFKGKLALPGGHVENESEEEAAIREVEEETGIKIKNLEEFGHYFGIDRDPRYPTYSVAFSAEPKDFEIKAGSDAKEAFWYPTSELKANDLAFDHWKILNDYFRWTRRILGIV
jgi:8-oxo-dGTP diphosphatase